MSYRNRAMSYREGGEMSDDHGLCTVTIDALRAEIERLKGEIAELQGNRDWWASECKQAWQSRDQNALTIKQLDSELAALIDRLDKLEKQ